MYTVVPKYLRKIWTEASRKYIIDNYMRDIVAVGVNGGKK